MFEYVQELIETENAYGDISNDGKSVYLMVTYKQEYLNLPVLDSFIKKHRVDLFGC